MDLSTILARARDDDASRAQIVDRFYPAVQRIVHRHLEAERRQGRHWMEALFSTGDVVHDVFLRVLQGVESFDGDERDFERYLAKSVIHRLVDALRYHEAARRNGRRIAGGTETLRGWLASPDTSPSSGAARREEAELVESALVALTARDRELIDRRLRRGEAYVEIARALGLPSADAARKATCLAEARLLVALRARGLDG